MLANTSKRSRRKAQAIVEFAFVLPILLLVLMGIVEFGRIFLAQQTITNASREGARVGILPTSTGTDVDNAVTMYMNSSGLTQPAVITVANVGPTVPPGAATSVTVQYQLPILTGSIIPGLGDTIALSHATVMRHE